MANWYKTSKPNKTAQATARYRGLMYYEVEIPATGDKATDQQAADKGASELYQQIFGLVGDQVFSYDPPERHS